MTGLFSQYAGESTLNLTEQAEEFIEFFQGKCKSWKGNASSHEKSEHGKITWRELRGHYSVITDEAQYEIAYIRLLQMKHNMKSHIFIFLFTEKNRIKKGLLR